ncbi:hypothetical protein AVEN_172330-1 [Araneus ventricosus]|uniref:Uncharacterized protein n=1 Tax=Araneus ventricosus TaxID=182803 RepID=A0A4Y2E1N5_ARAVE|nr:hypothetical protein AVEN_172330-1 [Araneus ventricosus]
MTCPSSVRAKLWLEKNFVLYLFTRGRYEIMTFAILPTPFDELLDIVWNSRREQDSANVLLHKILPWVYGINSPTRRIMENEGLFTNMQENT